ncbi:hypothetical protein [Nocardia sp. NPDC060249]|uniref:hypothetical protein n=1 Tax=Nocardia sp. NPDC060249 TaxID=3347082 RepID=UPI00366130F3
MTARVDLYVIGRLDMGDAAADVYCSEIRFDHAVDGAVCDRAIANWSRTLHLEPGASTDLDGLDHTMATAGYYRTGGWRVRITASGAVRYFAEATVGRRPAMGAPISVTRSGPA